MHSIARQKGEQVCPSAHTSFDMPFKNDKKNGFVYYNTEHTGQITLTDVLSA